jgi:predicted dehydrogenase
MTLDPKVDLVYVATPHSHHYEHAMLALQNGKPVLVEKAFTANAAQAERLIDEAHKRNLFIAEAIWTRYMPLSHKIREIMESGIIGEPRIITATLCYMMENKERIVKPELCGGALLDLGVYTLNFARMYFGTDIVRTVSNCHIGPTGMDMHECISLSYADGKMANLQSGALCLNDRQGIISGTEGYIRVDNINCPENIRVYRNYELVQTFCKSPDMINGYEYQVLEAKRCIENGLIESPMMPHEESISIMKQMDSLRMEWNVRYPMDEDLQQV